MGFKSQEDYVRYHTEYRATRREKLKLAARQYRKDNPEVNIEWQRKNPGKVKTKKAKHYRNNRERYNEQSRRNHYIRKYGITPEEKELRLVAQGYLCEICETPIDMTTGHTDHQHVPFKLRDILCRGCNPGIGNFRESPELLEKAAAYLRRHFSNPIVED